MGLLPLEFTDCLTDSPYFRDNLAAHEKELDRTSQAVKGIIRDIKELLAAAKTLSRAQRNLATTFQNFSFECIGNSQTDDEIIIAGSLKEFGRLLSSIEDERDRIVDSAQICFIEPLENFRKDHIGAAKEEKKKFEKETVKFCQSLERHLNMSTKKTENHIQEADASLDLEQRHFVQASLDYVLRLQEVHESKKFEFVERILLFMSRWLTFYHQGYEVCTEFKSFMRDLQMRIERTKINFDATKNEASQLKNKMLSKLHDPGSLNKMYTRQGYLFLLEKKALGTTSCTKHFCQYQKDTKKFAMIAFSQATNKILSSETLSVQRCLVRHADSIDKRFCFDIIVNGKSTPYTFQALSEKDYKLWLEAMDGKEPHYNHSGRNLKQEDYLLDEIGFNFVNACIEAIESRGLMDQGLYRVVGVSSKVTKLISQSLEMARKGEKMNLMDSEEFETKTITSALKTYFRNLPEPMMSFKLHGAFLAAAKQENFEKRVNDIHALVQFLPSVNRKMLEILIKHLRKVSQHADKNLMTVSNLGVCFGPTLLRPEEETMASIMDIKFCNVTVEVLIDNYDVIFGSKPPNDYHSPVGTKPEKQSPLSGMRNQSSSSLSEVDGRPATNRQESVPKENRSTPPAGMVYHHHLRPTSTNSKFWVDNRSSSYQNHQPQQSQQHPTNNYTVPATQMGQINHSNLPVSDNYIRGNGNVGGRIPRQSPAYITNPMWQEGGTSVGGMSNSVPTNHVSPEPNPAYSRSLSTTSTPMTNFQSPSQLQSQFHVQLPSSQQQQHSGVIAQHVSQSSQRVSYHSPPNSSPVAQHVTSPRYIPEARSPNAQTGPPPPKPIPTGPPGGRKVRTLFACVGENELELTFKPNEVIYNVKPSQEPGWLEGCLNGRIGLVPQNYVEFIN